MKKTALYFVVFTLWIGVVGATDEERPQNRKADISGQYVMLYYKDLAAPRDFYANTLGLTATFENEWVSLYKTTSTSYVGVVQEGRGYHQSREHNAVMLSIVTGNVDAWNEKLKSSENKVTFLKEIEDHEDVGVRAFLIQDPGGYTIEFFQWLEE